jgi:site-specific recombinase XerD
MVQDAIKLFLLKKTVEKLSHGVRLKYQRLLDRLRAFCDERGIYTVIGITPEVLIEFCATWEALYPSTITQANQRERLRSFFGVLLSVDVVEASPGLAQDNEGRARDTATDAGRI